MNADIYREGMRHYATLEVAAPARLRAWAQADDARIERAQTLIRRSLRRIAAWDAQSTVDETLDALRAQVGDRKIVGVPAQNARTLAAFRAKGTTEDTAVSLGGFGMIVTRIGNTLISIQPKGKSYRPKHGGLAGLTIWPHPAIRPFGGMLTLGRYTYALAAYDQPTRLVEALKLAAEAFRRADGDLDLFLEAVGESGQCAICGRFLSDPLSRARGIGPECIKTIYAGFVQADLDAERAAAVARAREQRRTR